MWLPSSLLRHLIIPHPPLRFRSRHIFPSRSHFQPLQLSQDSLPPKPIHLWSGPQDSGTHLVSYIFVVTSHVLSLLLSTQLLAREHGWCFILTTYIPGMSGMLGSVIHVRSSDNVQENQVIWRGKKKVWSKMSIKVGELPSKIPTVTPVLLSKWTREVSAETWPTLRGVGSLPRRKCVNSGGRAPGIFRVVLRPLPLRGLCPDQRAHDHTVQVGPGAAEW